jgi:hypothetical protein
MMYRDVKGEALADLDIQFGHTFIHELYVPNSQIVLSFVRPQYVMYIEPNPDPIFPERPSLARMERVNRL